MACKCKNQDGTPSQTCMGTCKLDVIKEQEIQQQRDPLNGFAELILAQVDKRLDLRLAKFHLELHDEFLQDYKKAFLEGLKEGIAIGRDMVDY